MPAINSPLCKIGPINRGHGPLLRLKYGVRRLVAALRKGDGQSVRSTCWATALVNRFATLRSLRETMFFNSGFFALGNC